MGYERHSNRGIGRLHFGAEGLWRSSGLVYGDLVYPKYGGSRPALSICARQPVLFSPERDIAWHSFPKGDAAQAKLVRCGRGAVLDVAVDLRKGSPTYKKWVAVELSAENKRQLFIPRGFGHGFVTLTDDVEFLYKEDNLYNPSTDRNILWNDPELGIDWRVENPILSEKTGRRRFCGTAM